MSYRFTILGCGSSGGVPRLGGEGRGADWGACDPANPKNRRRRCSMLVERLGPNGTTRVLIDTTPDMHAQLLSAGIGVLDGVAYTHAHADHTHGIDDLRQVVFNTGKRLQVWADGPTQESLLSRFAYAFVQPAKSPYPPILEMLTIDDDTPFTIDGAGGPITLSPFLCEHGSMDAQGFIIHGLAYLPDAVAIPEPHWPRLDGLKIWVVDALRRKPHPTHAHLALALEWIARAKPETAVLTNMHNDLDYQTLLGELPAHIRPAFDGMVIELPE